jgi:hypothetical protein
MAYPAMKIERAMLNVQPDLNSGCWLWAGSLFNTGYGRISVNSVSRLAHRYFFEQFKGAIPRGMNVLHKCDTATCVNPDHLYIGTNADNSADAVARKRLRPQRGEPSAAAKINPAIAAEIRRLVMETQEPQHRIAARYGISQASVSLISRNKVWTSDSMSADDAVTWIRRAAFDLSLNPDAIVDRVRAILHAFAAREGVTLEREGAA